MVSAPVGLRRPVAGEVDAVKMRGAVAEDCQRRVGQLTGDGVAAALATARVSARKERGEAPGMTACVRPLYIARGASSDRNGTHAPLWNGILA